MSSDGHLLAPEIDGYRREYERLAGEATALVAPLTEDQFNWRPAPGAWSVAECIDHLNVTARLYLPRLDQAIAEGIRRGLYGVGPFTPDLVGRLMLKSVEPPARFKLKAPASFRPDPTRGRSEILAGFRAYQVQFVDRLRQANGLDLRRAKVQSPASKWIRMSLGAGFALMAAHERRHLLQARSVIQAAGFPAS